MKKKITTSKLKEFDAGFLIYKLWQEKYIIISVTFLCIILMYVYISNTRNDLKAEIEINAPSTQLFEKYRSYITIVEKSDSPGEISSEEDIFTEDFMKDFLTNINSRKVMRTFAKYDYLNENFKNYFTENNIDLDIYFNNDVFGNVIGRNQKLLKKRFYFIYPQELDGRLFLNEYIVYVAEKTLIEFSKKIQSSIQTKIEQLSDALLIAEEIKLEEPVVEQQLSTQYLTVPGRELFFLGTKVLKIKIQNHERKLDSFSEGDLFKNYNPILYEAYINSKGKVPKSFYYFASIMLGLSLSFVIILVKFLVRPYLR